jgi:hypothetical protein
VTIASDVCSLGALRHELLTEAKPLALDRLSIRRGRASWPATWTRFSFGRCSRYAIGEELAADIERYLRHEPVRARPDSTGRQWDSPAALRSIRRGLPNSGRGRAGVWPTASPSTCTICRVPRGRERHRAVDGAVRLACTVQKRGGERKEGIKKYCESRSFQSPVSPLCNRTVAFFIHAAGYSRVFN